MNTVSWNPKSIENAFYNNNAKNAAATIAGPNGIYVLVSGLSRKPLNICAQV